LPISAPGASPGGRVNVSLAKLVGRFSDDHRWPLLTDPRGTAKRDPVPALAQLPPFGVWLLESGNLEDDAHAIAEGVRKMLAQPSETPVQDRATKKVRDVRAGDIAVLVSTNEAAAQVANALALRGIRAAVARAGLLSTPEGTMIDAALRALIDPEDSLSLAVLESLTGFEGLDADAWLEARIRHVAEKKAADLESREVAPQPPSEMGARIAMIREKLSGASPTEALDRIMSALDVAAVACRWPDPEQRLAFCTSASPGRGIISSWRCAKTKREIERPSGSTHCVMTMGLHSSSCRPLLVPHRKVHPFDFASRAVRRRRVSKRSMCRRACADSRPTTRTRRGSMPPILPLGFRGLIQKRMQSLLPHDVRIGSRRHVRKLNGMTSEKRSPRPMRAYLENRSRSAVGYRSERVTAFPGTSSAMPCMRFWQQTPPSSRANRVCRVPNDYSQQQMSSMCFVPMRFCAPAINYAHGSTRNGRARPGTARFR
jgi:hypothetical protein